MSIPSWISKTAHELGEAEKGNSPVNFSDALYEKLLGMYKEGKLDDWAAQIVEEIEYLRDVINVAADKVGNKVLGSVAKKAAPASVAVPELPKDPGTNQLIPEVPPPMPSGKSPNGPRLRPKIKEPETTKWKEIRFNKRTGTWQTVVTTRYVRNFATEDEAVEFTKKAELSSPKSL